jgi:hypothetical protein
VISENSSSIGLTKSKPIVFAQTFIARGSNGIVDELSESDDLSSVIDDAKEDILPNIFLYVSALDEASALLRHSFKTSLPHIII